MMFFVLLRAYYVAAAGTIAKIWNARMVKHIYLIIDRIITNRIRWWHEVL